MRRELHDDAVVRNWEKPDELKRLNGPVVGYVGNLDIARIDVDLLETLAERQRNWNFVFIGSMHMSREIRQLDRFENVHFLGVRVYEIAIRYIKHFDVAIIPHLDNDMTRSMNPLKLYVYFSLHVPVVTTKIANVGYFDDFVKTANTPEEFIQAVAEFIEGNPIAENGDRIRSLLENNSWEERVREVMALVEKGFRRRVDGEWGRVSVTSGTRKKAEHVGGQ